VEKAHEWQLKYYMYVFEQHGVTDVKGILEYPTLRKTQAVVLSDVDRDRIKEMVTDIERIISSDDCPPLQKKGICKNCSYYEFCYTKETDE
jgi:CRISPR-associated exonuclease Cas4